MSLSSSSSASQPAPCCPCASHSLTSVVLPNPAGAEISVSRLVLPPFSFSIRRGRRTRFEWESGAYKLGLEQRHAHLRCGSPVMTLHRCAPYAWACDYTRLTAALLHH